VRFCTNAGTDQRASPAAAQLIGDYFMPMAERVYGDVAASDRARAAAAVARWVFTKRPAELHARRLQREAAARIAYGRADPRSCRGAGGGGLVARAVTGHRVWTARADRLRR
jgi:hypothetical protein